jgi:hypothetical protein
MKNPTKSTSPTRSKLASRNPAAQNAPPEYFRRGTDMLAKETIKQMHRIEIARHHERLRGPRKKSKRITSPRLQMEAWAKKVRRVMRDAAEDVDRRLEVMLAIFKEFERRSEYNRQIADGEIVRVEGCPCPVYVGSKKAKRLKLRCILDAQGREIDEAGNLINVACVEVPKIGKGRAKK